MTETFSVPDDKVLSTTAQRIVKNNPNRVGLIFANLETIDCVIDIDNKLTATKGIPLDPSGGQQNLTKAEDGDLVTRAWWAIAASGTPTIRVIEVIKRSEKKVP